MYSKCLNCQNPGRECLKRLLTMTGDELLIWCKARKKSLGLSNADIAAATNVPKGTERISRDGSKNPLPRGGGFHSASLRFACFWLWR